MRNAIVIGATGLVGQQLLADLAQHSDYERIYSLSRRPPETVFARVEPLLLADFTQLPEMIASLPLSGADAFSCLGTTLRQAGSREAFKAIDYGYNLAFAQACLSKGCQHLLLLSAAGADHQSRIFYSRVKGELEVAVRQLGFARLSIFQPSLLLGQHADFRPGESIARSLFGVIKPLVPAHWPYRPIEAPRVAAAMRVIALRQGVSDAKVAVYSNQSMLRLG